MVKNGINKKRLLESFVGLLRVNSPSFKEKEIGNLLCGKLRDRGCSVSLRKYDKSFNIVALKKGNVSGARPLLLSGHMDTIEPTEGIRFNIEANRVRSTGNTVLGADDKSALAQILEALTVIQERDLPHGDIEIVFTSAEERGLCGAKMLDFGKIRSRHGLVLDSNGSVGRLVVAAPAQITYEIRITGKAAHAGMEPEKGISAIRAAAEVISSVPDGRINAATTANIGIVSGGTATNVVPKEVVIHGELRGHDPRFLQNTRKELFAAARMAAKKNRAGIRITEREEYQAFRIDEQDRFLGFMDRIVTQCGMTPVHVVTGGGSDANIFNRHGIKTINMSTGMQKVHSYEEFILLKDLYQGSLAALTAITEFVKFAGG